MLNRPSWCTCGTICDGLCIERDFGRASKSRLFRYQWGIGLRVLRKLYSA